MRRILLALLIVLPSWAGQSLVMSNGKYAYVALPAGFNGLTDLRLEFRLHGWSGNGEIVGTYSEQLKVRVSSGSLEALNTYDTMSPGGEYPYISLSGRTDIVVRLQRNAIGKLWTMEIWDADGSDYAVSSKTIGTLGVWNTGTLSFPIAWDASIAGNLAYFRWYSTLLTLNSPPPHGISGGDLLEYEFEGNGNDGVDANNLTFSGGAASYTATPAILPTSNAGVDAIARTGEGIALDGSGSVADSTLSYSWVRTSGPGSVTFTPSATVESPTAIFGAAGEYVLTLTVTDLESNTDDDTVTVGAVTTDANYVVQTGSTSVDSLLGPLLMYGKSPWTWFDDRHRALADFFGGLYTTETGWNDDQWNTALAGTISTTYGSSTITGSGTAFQTDFCGGGTAPVGNYTIVIWYDNGGGDFGRVMYYVNACPSQTSLTLDNGGGSPQAYTTKTGTQTGLSYARWTYTGTWIGNATNINFYDSVLAHYALYYRTGLTKYRDYARTLADRWYTMPFIDEGRRGWLMNPRNMAIGGLILRALDGKPEYWTGIEALLDSVKDDLDSTMLLQDIREDGYRIGYVALGALLDPNPTKRASYVTALENALTVRWGPQQRVDGSWDMITWGFDTWDYYPTGSTVNVTNGNSTVTLVPGGGYNSWAAADVAGGAKFWVASNLAHNDKSLDDPVYYTPSWVDSTHLLLDRPYEGTTATGRGWQLQGGTLRPYGMGRGTQPFQLGIVGTSWYWAYLALTAAVSEYADEARQFVLDVADWLTSTGYDPTYKGLYWFRNSVGCEPIASHMNDVACRCELGSCTTGDISPMRYLNSEIIRVYSAAYALTGTAAYKTQGDKLFGAMWGGPSAVGPEADAYYNDEYADGGWTFITKKAKNLGFAFGFGAGSSWPAARLAGEEIPPEPIVGGWTIWGSVGITGSISIK